MAVLFAAGLSAQSLPEGPGKDLVEVICSACHEPTRVMDKHWAKTEWQGKVLEMLQEEPDVTQPERDKIIDYLSKNFPKKVNVNKAASKEIEDALELSTKDADAIVRYRTDKGSFKTLDDLKKVPGLDAAKIEGEKERLEF